ncbi:MAG: glycerate kinase [Rhodococcus sp. (in: high G+C Gram-positive bacteria)]
MKILFAPDSYKGTIGSVDAALALRDGWASVRDGDELVLMPQADGGEGTLDVLAACTPGSRWSVARSVHGPDGRPVDARWLTLADGRAMIELAEPSGIALMDELDAFGAGTRGLGEVIAAARADRLSIALGGSASTDGGLGVLRALGLRVLDAAGADVPEGATGLIAAATVDPSGLMSAPADVELLTDTSAVLCGVSGAAHVFGPQKGASPDDVEVLDAALAKWAELLAGAGLVADPDTPGVGAAGATAFGLCAWGAHIAPGAQRVSELTGLADATPTADLVVTGEGKFDRTSLTGKLVGHVVGSCQASGVRVAVVAGQVAHEMEVETLSLCEIAGSSEAAMSDTRAWLVEAGRRLAGAVPTRV